MSHHAHEVEVKIVVQVVYRSEDAFPRDIIIPEYKWKGVVQPEPYLFNDRLLLEIRAENLALMKCIKELRRVHSNTLNDYESYRVLVLRSKFKTIIQDTHTTTENAEGYLVIEVNGNMDDATGKVSRRTWISKEQFEKTNRLVDVASLVDATAIVKEKPIFNLAETYELVEALRGLPPEIRTSLTEKLFLNLITK